MSMAQQNILENYEQNFDDSQLEMEEIVFIPPRFIDMESGEEFEPEISNLKPKDIVPGEVVHLVRPGQKQIHYRINELKYNEDGSVHTALATKVPKIYGSAFLLMTILVLGWFVLKGLFKFIF